MSLDAGTADTIATLGCIAEHASAEELDSLDNAIRLLHDFVRFTRTARKSRLAGHIEAAVRAESRADYMHSSLPKECQW